MHTLSELQILLPNCNNVNSYVDNIFGLQSACKMLTCRHALHTVVSVAIVAMEAEARPSSVVKLKGAETLKSGHRVQ